MNLCIMKYQFIQAAWDHFAPIVKLMSADFLCSMTVNMSILTLVLMGAIGLVTPFEWRGLLAKGRS